MLLQPYLYEGVFHAGRKSKPVSEMPQFCIFAAPQKSKFCDEFLAAKSKSLAKQCVKLPCVRSTRSSREVRAPPSRTSFLVISNPLLGVHPWLFKGWAVFFGRPRAILWTVGSVRSRIMGTLAKLYSWMITRAVSPLSETPDHFKVRYTQVGWVY